MYQHAKFEAGEMFDLKILQLEWLRAFWPITQEQHFSQIEDLYGNTVNNINFHYRTNSGEINDQIFLQIQKTCFRTIFAHFPSFWEGEGGAKKAFPKNLAIRFSSIMSKFRET